MKKRMWKTLLIPCLTIVFLMSSIQPAFASYNTLYLSYDRDDFYTDSRKRSSSFSFEGHTYQYELASSIQYWSFNHYDTDYSSLGTIRVAGGAEITSPSGARGLGVTAVTVKLTLYPIAKAAWWHWWYSITQQDGEIAIWESHLATINLKVQKSGDQTLRDITATVLDDLFGILGVPFSLFSIAYLLVPGGGLDKDAGPRGGDMDAHVTGDVGQPTLTNPVYLSDHASLAFDFAYRYLKEGASGWKSYDLGIEVSASFGYTYQHQDRELLHTVTTKSFQEHWIVYVYWDSGGGGGGGGEPCPTLFVWNGNDYIDYGVIDIHDPTGEDLTREVPIQAEDVAISNHKAMFRLREGWPGLEFSESDIDNVKLYAVDDCGNRYLCPLISAEHCSSGNVLPQLLLSDDWKCNISLLETIDLEFALSYQGIEDFVFVLEGNNMLKP